MSERKGRYLREEQKERPRRCRRGAEVGGSMMSGALDTTPQLAEMDRRME